MNNPFLFCTNDDKHTIYLDSNCSINKIIIAKLPFEEFGEDVNEIRGKSAEQIFSTKVIIEEIKKRAGELGIDLNKVKDKDLPKEISKALFCEDRELNQRAETIVKKFGYRLGIILLTLKTGLKENREAREGWNDEHWAYWADIRRVILVGGLSNDKFGESLKKYATKLFIMANVTPYEILLFNNASHLGVMGCTTLITQKDSVNIVFDFGQTNIKRSIVTKKHGRVIDERCMPSIDSKYMELYVTNHDEKLRLGTLLHNYLIDNVIKTYYEVSEKHNVGDEIIISIANYTMGSKLNCIRGGYAKLTALSDDYAAYFEEELSKKLGKKLKVTFIHDGTAIALHFKEYTKTVCISLGTAFGVGFPNADRE